MTPRNSFQKNTAIICPTEEIIVIKLENTCYCVPAFGCKWFCYGFVNSLQLYPYNNGLGLVSEDISYSIKRVKHFIGCYYSELYD